MPLLFQFPLVPRPPHSYAMLCRLEMSVFWLLQQALCRRLGGGTCRCPRAALVGLWRPLDCRKHRWQMKQEVGSACFALNPKPVGPKPVSA